AASERWPLRRHQGSARAALRNHRPRSGPSRPPCLAYRQPASARAARGQPFVHPARSRHRRHAHRARRDRKGCGGDVFPRTRRLSRPQPRRRRPCLALSPMSASLQRLLAIMSPAFPVGGFAWSAGLETAIAEGIVTDAGKTRVWLEGLLHHGGLMTDAILLCQAHRRTAAGLCVEELAELSLA